MPGIFKSLDGQIVWKEYDCSNKKLPFILIEKNEILPARVQRGKEIQHHLVYVACTSKDQDVVIIGKLSRKIYYRGHVMFQDTTPNFQIIPGQWNVNAVIAIPPKVKPGDYDFELTLSSPTTTVKRNLSFVVQK
jgi:hypothetical protein